MSPDNGPSGPQGLPSDSTLFTSADNEPFLELALHESCRLPLTREHPYVLDIDLFSETLTPVNTSRVRQLVHAYRYLSKSKTTARKTYFLSHIYDDGDNDDEDEKLTEYKTLQKRPIHKIYGQKKVCNCCFGLNFITKTLLCR
jgi:hypothetical protein